MVRGLLLADAHDAENGSAGLGKSAPAGKTPAVSANRSLRMTRILVVENKETPFRLHSQATIPRAIDQCPALEGLVVAQETPLAERQIAELDATDAYALEADDAQTDEFAHAPDLSFAPFVQDET